MSIRRKVKNSSLILEQEDGSIIAVITETLIDRSIIFEVEGKLTSETLHDFGDETLAASAVCDRIEFDFRGLRYISNAVLKALLELQHIMEEKGGEILMRNIGETVMRDLEAANLEDMFDIV